MTALALVNPIGQFFDLDGSPLQGGSMYFGTVNLNPITSPTTVYWDAAATQPASQPVRTLNGYPVRNGTAAAVYAVGNVSMLVLNGAGQQVLYARSSADIGGAASVQIALDAFAADLASATDAAKGAGLSGYDSLLDHGSGKTVGAALSGAGRILQGADPTGATDNTALLKALFDVCIPAGTEAIIPAGTYKVSGPITAGGTGGAGAIAAGALRIRCVGEVTIEVDAASTAFMRLFTCFTTAINSCTVLGGKLILNLNNKAACGMYIRHAGGQGGTVRMDNVEVNDVYEPNSTAGMEISGIWIYGRYTSVILNNPRVDGVDRTLAGGVCKGISVSELDGVCEINSPYVARVACGAGTVDADGIAVFGYASSGTTGSDSYKWRNGSCKITRPVLVDNKGRGLKFQISDVVVDTPSFYRQMVVSLSVPEMDFQVGGDVRVIAPYYEYRKNGATSPLHADFYLLALQGNCNDRPNRFQIRGGTVRTEVAFPYFSNVVVDPTYNLALDVAVDIEGIEFQGINGLGTVVSSCLLRTQVDQIQAAAGNTHICLRNVRADVSGFPWIGYTGAATTAAAEFSWSVTDCENTGAASLNTKPAWDVSGTRLQAPGGFMCRDNINTSDYLGLQSFDYQALKVGCRFHYDTDAASVVTNGPGGMVTGAGIYAFVDVLGSFSSGAYKNIMVIKQDANAANTVFYTHSGTWGTIK